MSASLGGTIAANAGGMRAVKYGLPPEKPGSARLYLSGADAGQVQDMFAGTPLEPRIVAGPTAAASAVKMAYASWTKGTAAMLLAARALALAEGVEDALLSEWDISQPQLAGLSARSARGGVTKGWRCGHGIAPD